MQQQSDTVPDPAGGRGDRKGRLLAPLTSASVDQSGALLGEAFLDDPVVRYYFDGRNDRAEAVHSMMTAATTLALRFGSAWRLDVDDKLAGVALLLPPDRRDFPLAAVLLAVLRRPRLWRARGLRRYFGVAASVAAHRPEGPFQTLVSLGLRPADQGRGHGSWLLDELLGRLPSAPPVFLETYNERNLRFYAARDFRVTSRFAADGGKGPTTWTLLRAGADL